jgi:hypothetical protein
MPKKKNTPNKSEFIRQHANLPAAALIAKAKKEGLKISSSLVYMVRGASKSKGASKPKVTVAKRRGPGRPPAAARSTTADASFRAMVLELGVPRSKALIEEVDRRLKSFVASL